MAEHTPGDKATLSEFHSAVNMTASQLKKWLDTDESKEVGQKKDSNESVGHQSGRRIITLLGKKQADFTSDDYDHMKKVTGYVHRHLEQRPDGDVSDTRWRYSLMNWGHDPLK
jgi:hypothetical protein